MGIAQTKRIQVIDNTVSAGAQLNVTLKSGEDACNVHGLILDLWVGGQVLTQHNFGKWALSTVIRSGAGAPNLTTTSLNAETDNPVIWMLGAWMIVDPDRIHVGGAPRTSRNCASKSKIVFSLENSAVSAGAVRVHGVCTWFETTK